MVAEQSMEKITNIATYGGSVLAIISGLSLNQWGVVIGIIVGVLGMVGNLSVNIYFKLLDYRLKKYRLQQELSGLLRRKEEVDEDGTI